MTSTEALIGMQPPPRNAAKVPLPETSTIRKSPYGRALLWTDSDKAVSREICCSSSIAHRANATCVYHSHLTNGRSGEEWSAPTASACWHCCHAFSTPPVPLPRSFDTHERNFVVFGNFCSLRCAKGFLVESDIFDSPFHLSMFTKMAREVYGCTEVVAAPPRFALAMFGGPYTIEQFRDDAKQAVLLAPPFVTSYMVVEERRHAIEVEGERTEHATGTVRGLRRPAQAVHVDIAPVADGSSPYEAYCSEPQCTGPPRAPVTATNAATDATDATATGPCVPGAGTLGAFLAPRARVNS
jgi:hypothetical protein